MRDKYYPPKLNEKKFHCIHCGVYAHHGWLDTKVYLQTWEPSGIRMSICAHCEKRTYWYEEKMVFPQEVPVEPPHPDLPEDCTRYYIEARNVFPHSARAAAALLRLCIQTLMPHLGQKGDNINEDIKSLVSEGLPVLAQKALDYCRVVGNNAVHPGEINLDDTPEIAENLFGMINFIVEDRITRPKEIEALYSRLPEDSRKAIEHRDADSTIT